MQLGEGLVQQQGAAGVGALRKARHGRVQRRSRVGVLTHRVLRQQPHVLRPAPPCRCTHRGHSTDGSAACVRVPRSKQWRMA